MKMTLEQFMPGLKKRCEKCRAEIPEGVERKIQKKGKEIVVCRLCFRKELGAKDEDGTNGLQTKRITN